jgi:hypothetical protein
MLMCKFLLKINNKCGIYKPRELVNNSVKKIRYIRNLSQQIAEFFLLLDAVAYNLGH